VTPSLLKRVYNMSSLQVQQEWKWPQARTQLASQSVMGFQQQYSPTDLQRYSSEYGDGEAADFVTSVRANCDSGLEAAIGGSRR
jgi:hypothetical protein